MFSHQDFTHLLVNCGTLYSFGGEGKDGREGRREGGREEWVINACVPIFKVLLLFPTFTHLFSLSFPPPFLSATAAVLLGARRFLNLYFVGGLASSLGCIAWPFVAPT